MLGFGIEGPYNNITSNSVYSTTSVGISLPNDSAQYNLISNNTLSLTQGDGISLGGGPIFNIVTNNTVTGGTNGIYLSGSSFWDSHNNTVAYNRLSNTGISVNWCSNITLIGNTIENATDWAIYTGYDYGVDAPNSTTIINNIITNCHDGMGIFSPNNLISGNTVLDTDICLYFDEGATGNIVTDNIALSIDSCALYIARTSGNTFYHNDFVGQNTEWSLYEAGANNLDNGSMGNFWSTQDGASISTYQLDGNNTDHHPVTSPIYVKRLTVSVIGSGQTSLSNITDDNNHVYVVPGTIHQCYCNPQRCKLH